MPSPIEALEHLVRHRIGLLKKLNINDIEEENEILNCYLKPAKNEQMPAIKNDTIILGPV